MKNYIIITGGAGFIGSNLAFYLQKNFPKSKCIGCDCFRNDETFNNGNLKSFGHYKNLIGFKGEIISGNINNKDDLGLLGKYIFDFIFHHAAISDTRVYDQEIIMKTNVNSFYSLLRKANEDNSILIYASSAATYGNLPSPQTEGFENPENTYGFSKYIMDQIALSFSNQNPEMTIVGLRYFNVYGPRARTSGTYGAVFGVFLAQKISNKPFTVVGDGTQTRDFTFVSDIVDALTVSAKSNVSGEIINIGSNATHSINKLVKLLGGDLVYIPKRPGEPDCTWADISKASKLLDWYPKISLEEGVEILLNDLKYWEDAPLWDKDSIAKATEKWFQYLGK